MSAAHLVRAVRRRHGISQASLACRCRTSQTHISRIERGEVSPTIDTLERILETMGERLDITVAPAPHGNQSNAEVLADAKLSPAQLLVHAAELSFALTTIAASRTP